MNRNQNRICTAHKTNGEPCGQYAAKGTTICRYHGGAAPQVKAAAQRRLMEAVDPLMAELLKIAFNAADDRLRLAAIRDALDRAGVAPPKQVEISIEDAMTTLDREIARLETELDIDPSDRFVSQ